MVRNLRVLTRLKLTWCYKGSALFPAVQFNTACHVDQSKTSVCLVEQPIRIVPVGKTFTCSGLVCIRSWKSIVTVLIRERLNKIIEFIQKVSRFEFENCLNYLQVLSSKLFSMKFSRIKPKLAHILRYFHVNFYGLIVTQKTCNFDVDSHFYRFIREVFSLIIIRTNNLMPCFESILARIFLIFDIWLYDLQFPYMFRSYYKQNKKINTYYIIFNSYFVTLIWQRKIFQDYILLQKM